MPDVFVSFAHEDVDRVEPLVALLKHHGFSVWWDREIEPGTDFEHSIESALAAASCLLVALTRHARASTWVRAETAVGQAHGKVIPVLLDDVEIPTPLRTTQCADLRTWRGENDELARRLLSAVAAYTGTNPAENGFIGRAKVAATMQGAVDVSLAGQTRVLLLAGEPGIGKTSCAENLAAYAEDQGMLVLWGQCSGQEGAPAFWPWMQILREYAEANSEDELRMRLDSRTAGVLALVPEIGERLGVRVPGSDDYSDSTGRFRLFDAVSNLLRDTSVDLPVVLILEDVHWADGSSLALLEHTVDSLRRQPVLIVCTYREEEMSRASPLRLTLGELTRLPTVERIQLDGLDKSSTGVLAAAQAGIRLPKYIVNGIHAQTDGNPLFIKEIARSIAHKYQSSDDDVIVLDVPDGVREAIGRRLSRLTPECNKLLSAASVIGRHFEARLLAQLIDQQVADCVEALEDAVDAGILEPARDGAAAYRFSHAVIRESLYDELPMPRRLRLHRNIADCLAADLPKRGPTMLTQLAHHYRHASPLGDFETAIDFALRAAEHDASIYAFEAAVRHYDEALEVIAANHLKGDSRLGRIYFEQGKVLEALGRFDDAGRRFVRALEFGRGSDPGLFANSVMSLVYVNNDRELPQSVPLLEEALEMVGKREIHTRAHLLGHLAFALRGSGDIDRITEIGEQAIECALTSGDARTAARAYEIAIMGLRGHAETLTRRLQYGQKMLSLASQMKNPHEHAHCMLWHLRDLQEAGEFEQFGVLYETYSRLADEFQLHYHQYHALTMKIMLRLLHGQWQDAESLIERTLELGSRLDRDGTESAYGMHMFVLNRDLGRLPGLAPILKQMLTDPNNRMWKPGLMIMCCEMGLDEQARSAFDDLAVDDFGTIARDDMWMSCMVFCTEACAYLGDPERAAILYRLLLPYAEQPTSYANGICFGAAARFLGLLANVLGEYECAEEHFRFALALNRKIGAWPALVRTQVEFGRMLLGQETEEGKLEAGSMLADAEQLADRIQMAGMSAEIAELLGKCAGKLPDGLSAREAEVLALIAIGRSNKDIAKVLSISVSTVATHIRNILQKTGCANRTEAAAYAMREGLDWGKTETGR